MEATGVLALPAVVLFMLGLFLAAEISRVRDRRKYGDLPPLPPPPPGPKPLPQRYRSRPPSRARRG